MVPSNGRRFDRLECAGSQIDHCTGGDLAVNVSAQLSAELLANDLEAASIKAFDGHNVGNKCRV